MRKIDLAGVVHASRIEHVWQSVTSQLAQYGFDRVIYGYTRYRTERNLGDPKDLFLLSNHGNDYIGPFVEDGLYYHAPMVLWTLENDGVCSWDHVQTQVEAGAYPEETMKVIEFNKKFNVNAGFTVSFQSDNRRSKGGMALTAAEGISQSEANRIWEEHGSDLEILANVAHLKIQSLPFTPIARTLTTRQQQVLEWVGDGKSIQDIATILGLGIATVEKHLRLARESLDVETTAQAVLKAWFQNQIFIVSD